MALEVNENAGYDWTNDDGRWGPKAAQVAHPAYVEFIEDLVDRGSLYTAFQLIMYPRLFYGWPEYDDPPSTDTLGVPRVPRIVA